MRSSAESNYLAVHEDWQVVPLVDFVAARWYRLRQLPALPPPTAIQDEVFARLDHGRWIADCPVQGCGGALLVSKRTPIFICPYCASLENAGHWYRVRFPVELAAIERELLKRPAPRGALAAANRNWSPGETVADLQRENAEHGIR